MANSELNQNNLIKNCQGTKGIMAAGAMTNLDYLIADDALVTGFRFLFGGGVYGDTLTGQSVDVSGDFTGTPGEILSQFFTNLNITPNQLAPECMMTIYPSKVFVGITLRMIYNSVGTSDVSGWANYDLEKILI